MPAIVPKVPVDFVVRLAGLFLVLGSIYSYAADLSIPCVHDPARLELRSQELQKIVNADQADRVGYFDKTPEERARITARDTERRMRVGQIFGEGCFSKAEDYAAAALVYQHGNSADHFYQTFIWSKRAVELGDQNQKRLMALGIDRYLVNIGHKQLFASQASNPNLNPNTCWCLDPIESSFPDFLRKEISGKNLAEQVEWLKQVNEGRTCDKTECQKDLKPSPRGTVPGFW